MSLMRSKRILGYTILEMVIAVGIAGLLVAALSVFFGRIIGSNRGQFSQVLSTEDARIQMRQISEHLRDARELSQHNWLLAAGNYEIKIASDIDDDGEIEQVRYFLDGDNLRRGITEPSASESVRTVARSIKNVSRNSKLFGFYTAEGEALSPSEATSANVERVVVSLHVGSVLGNRSESAELLVELTPFVETTNTSRMWPVSLDFPQDPTVWGLNGVVNVTITNPNTNEQTTFGSTIRALNNGVLETYSGGYYVNLNYQTETINGSVPGWYSWVGPVYLGASGAHPLQKIDKFSHSGLCLGSDSATLLGSCQRRWVGTGSGVEETEHYKSYLPIVLYRGPAGEVDYVRDITYNLTTWAPLPDDGGSSTSPTPTDEGAPAECTMVIQECGETGTLCLTYEPEGCESGPSNSPTASPSSDPSGSPNPSDNPLCIIFPALCATPTPAPPGGGGECIPCEAPDGMLCPLFACGGTPSPTSFPGPIDGGDCSAGPPDVDCGEYELKGCFPSQAGSGCTWACICSGGNPGGSPSSTPSPSATPSIPPEPYCGDGSCDEDPALCPIDCGYTPTPTLGEPSGYCGDGICNEDPGFCSIDCGWDPTPTFGEPDVYCGDGICNEDPALCTLDCVGTPSPTPF